MSLMLTQGNALRIPLADESVHCVMTSPPYWGLRDYGTATWEGGDPECDHIAYRPSLESGLRNDGRKHKGLYEGEKATMLASPYKDECKKCGAIRIDNQLGLEPTPEQYVENMVAVFREVKRVLRADGTLWLNMGDSYASSGGKGANRYFDGRKDEYGPGNRVANTAVGGLKVKDLCGIPWRLAFALQADGWWLRSDIIWSKPNPMPESVTDRPTKAHEYLFLLTKSAKYFYDADAVREAHKPYPFDISTNNGETKGPPLAPFGAQTLHSKRGRAEKASMYHPSGRNRRTVWHIATAPYSGAHFATYPPALVEPCIKAGTSERGVCPECGNPWVRVVEKTTHFEGGSGKAGTKAEDIKGKWGDKRYGENILLGPVVDVQTLGWRPTCECHFNCPDCGGTGMTTDAPYPLDEGWKPCATCDPIPATVFDPFAGSGTTLQVARALGRHGVGLDLSLEYLYLARKRLSLDALEAWGKAKKGDTVIIDLPMFEELK